MQRTLKFVINIGNLIVAPLWLNQIRLTSIAFSCKMNLRTSLTVILLLLTSICHRISLKLRLWLACVCLRYARDYLAPGIGKFSLLPKSTQLSYIITPIAYNRGTCKMTQNSARTHRCNATSELENTSVEFVTVGFNSHLRKMNDQDYVQIIATH